MNDHRTRHATNGLPTWLNITVVLVLLGDFSFNIIFIGPEGYPTNIILGGLLGAYAGLDQIIRRRKDQAPPDPSPLPPATVEPPGGGTTP